MPCTDVHVTVLHTKLLSLCSCGVLHCSAVSAYPVRLCVANIKTDDVHWVTVGYIPMVLRK